MAANDNVVTIRSHIPSVPGAPSLAGMPLEAANVAALERMIAGGQAKVAQGLDALNREWNLRQDRIVKPAGLDLRVEADKIVPVIGGQGFEFTDHARAQMLTSLASGMPRYAENLLTLGLSDLLQTNLNAVFARVGGGGVMVRSVDRQIKAVLSPSFRRMDAAPIFEAFITQALAFGLVPQTVSITDTRCLAAFVKPEIVWISDTEALVYGAELRTSDYGNGALQLAVTITRLLCTNGLVGTNLFRKVHLGKRFESEGSVFQLSAATETLDHKALQSAVKDAVKALPPHFAATTEILKGSVSKTISLASALTNLGKKGLTKATVEKVRALYETEQPIESLPQAPGAWRLANVLSLIANSAKGDAAIDLRDLAGQVVDVDYVEVKAA